MILATPYHFFSRAQLLAALQALPAEDEAMRAQVLAFLDSDVAKANLTKDGVFIFQREPMLQALELHVSSMPVAEAERVRIKVLAFLDGDVAKAHALIVQPKFPDL